MKTVKTLILILILFSSLPLTPIWVQCAEDNPKYHLTVNVTPSDSRIRIMNIRPKYRPGIALKPGKYDIEVTRSGYESKRWWVEIKDTDLTVDVILNKTSAFVADNLNYQLTINATPSDSRIRIMNIRPKYRPGIALKPGKYDIKVTRSGYESKRWWVEIKEADLTLDVTLNKLGAKPVQPFIQNEPDDAVLIQSALQLRQTRPELFSGAQGVLIVKVEPNSQAEKNGLRRGDIIIAYAKQLINSSQQLIYAVETNMNQPQKVLLQFIRTNVVQTRVFNSGYIGVRLADIKKELSVEQFNQEFFTALQAEDTEKIGQLLIDNPETAKAFQQKLLLAGEGVGEEAEQARALAELMAKLLEIPRPRRSYPELDRLQEEGEKAFYESKYPSALEKWHTGLKKAQELGDKGYISQFLGNLGVVYQNLGDYPKALDYYQQALTIDKEIGDKRGIGSDLTNLGVVYDDLGDYPKALDYYQQALKIKKEIGDKRGIGNNLTNLGVVYDDLGDYPKAKKAFQDSVVIFEKLGSGEPWKALRGLAATEAKLNQPELAIEHYDQALDNLEKIRNRLTKAHKTAFMRDKLYVYDELIALLQLLHSSQSKKGYDRKAFETFERKQGRVFLEEMGQSGARRFDGLDNDIIVAEQSLALKWQQAQSLSPQEYAALDEAEAQLKARIKAESPKYYALKYPQPVDLATLQNPVLEAGEMMLVYSVMKENTVLWVIGKQTFQMFTLPVDEKTLKQKMRDLRGYLSNSSLSEEFPKTSLQLYDMLLPKKVRQLIKGAEILYIVPTGPLYGLPFGALVTGYEPDIEIHYLIKDYAISYLSSASLLKLLRQEKSKTAAPEPFLAFADPDYPPCAVGNEQESETLALLRTKSYLKSTKGGCFNRLAATADEVREIANLFKADHSKALYLGSKASRHTVFVLNKENKLDDYRYLMFSVHGVIPSQFNQISQPALVLSNPFIDGYLTMADAFTLNLNADFVNLSACNTGCAKDSCGENVRGEGIMGLTRAFMYAGTARVAVTLWSVNLYSAKVLSVGLFRNLKASKKMAHALREIKLKMIEGKVGHEKYRNPYHWAPFVVYGDGQ
jgi:CHAT domain-containing protein/tetratricopeptide (TPR) repeat protein